MTAAAPPPTRFERLRPDLADGLAELFAAIAAAGDDETFHPHPFTRDQAVALANHEGRDLYFVALEGDRVLGYGMLRGWDAGFEVPSLGIAMHPRARGRGLGRALMHFLHDAARGAGARRIRLKVYPDNVAAVRLYESLGYRFVGEEQGQRVGYLEL